MIAAHRPNPIAATLGHMAGLRPISAPVTLLDASPCITVLERADHLQQPTTLLAAIEGSTRLSAKEISDVITPLRQAMDRMRTQGTSYADWLRFASAINIAMSIEHGGVVRGLKPDLDESRAAIDAIGQRGGERTTWRTVTLYASEIRLASRLIHQHEFQISNLACKEYAQARDHAIARVRSSGGEIVRHALC